MDELTKIMNTIGVFMDRVEKNHQKILLSGVEKNYIDVWGINATGDARGGFMRDIAIHNIPHAQREGYYLPL